MLNASEARRLARESEAGKAEALKGVIDQIDQRITVAATSGRNGVDISDLTQSMDHHDRNMVARTLIGAGYKVSETDDQREGYSCAVMWPEVLDEKA